MDIGFWDLGEVAFFAAGAFPVNNHVVAVLLRGPPFQMLWVAAPSKPVAAFEVPGHGPGEGLRTVSERAHNDMRADYFTVNAEDAIAFVVARVRED
jgi:hypothetical protein